MQKSNIIYKDNDDDMSIEDIEDIEDYNYEQEDDDEFCNNNTYDEIYDNASIKYNRIVKLGASEDIDEELASMMNRSFNLDEQITILEKNMTYLEEIFNPFLPSKFEDISLQSDKLYYFQMMEMFHDKNKQYLQEIHFDNDIPLESSLDQSLRHTIQYYEENFQAIFTREEFFHQKQYLFMCYTLYKSILEYVSSFPTSKTL